MKLKYNEAYTFLIKKVRRQFFNVANRNIIEINKLCIDDQTTFLF